MVTPVASQVAPAVAVYSAIKAEVVEHDAAPRKVPSTLKVDIGFEMDIAET